ncbi:unnamed protein product [Clavelina lepadiformis]|uniref:SCP domain-containing protein n=1 Tax=Clavelina lepadiformis TaxID=159417 RepID=A0ABP0G1I9_CLALP
MRNFTQVVWKESTHVGIGIASGAKGTFVVANYKPAGNVTNRGYFEKNVCPVERKRSDPSSSNSEENESVFVEKLAQSGTETEIKDNTDVEEFTDEKGCRVRKTVKTTTTTTTKGNSKTTSVKTDVDIEYLNESDSRKDNLGKVFDDVICIPPGEKSSESIGSRSSSRSSNSSDEVVSKKMSGSDRKTFEDQSIKRHNELRKIHGASPLRRSGKLREKAQKWAERLLSLRRLQHSNDIEYGENVAYKFSLDRCLFEGNEIVDMWYEGLRNYDYTKAQFSSETGNFTQIVWENSTEIGVGVADDGEGTIYAVAKYYPAGNVKGLFYKNVKPPKQ